MILLRIAYCVLRKDDLIRNTQYAIRNTQYAKTK